MGRFKHCCIVVLFFLLTMILWLRYRDGAGRREGEISEPDYRSLCDWWMRDGFAKATRKRWRETTFPPSPQLPRIEGIAVPILSSQLRRGVTLLSWISPWGFLGKRRRECFSKEESCHCSSLNRNFVFSRQL